MGRRFTFTVAMTNASFDEYPNEELAALLTTVAARVKDSGDTLQAHPVRDGNGNIVGQWEITEDMG